MTQMIWMDMTYKSGYNIEEEIGKEPALNDTDSLPYFFKKTTVALKYQKNYDFFQ